jgi:heme exporter protein C
MRKKAIIVLSVLAVPLLVRNLYLIFLPVPDGGGQGALDRLIYLHAPAAFTAYSGFFAALVASIMFLLKKEFRYDSLAVAATEVSLTFAVVSMATGAIWSRRVWGIWWTWDAGLTVMAVCFLLYLSYLSLRPAIEEPTARARLTAVYSIFAFADIPIVWYTIKWLRAESPAPAFRGGGMQPSGLLANWPAFMMVAAVLILLRLQQEEMRREIDGLRRLAHA